MTVPVCRHTGLGVPECCCRPCIKRMIAQHTSKFVSWCGDESPAAVPYQEQSEDFCHCGAPLNGSDHCQACGCEAYERYCNFVYQPTRS